jgi:hypothetical protein
MTPNRKMTKQISFKAVEPLRKRLQEAATAEERKLADFMRKLTQWAIDQYERVGSLPALRRMTITPARKRLSHLGRIRPHVGRASKKN